jgi:hypothetical protein
VQAAAGADSKGGEDIPALLCGAFRRPRPVTFAEDGRNLPEPEKEMLAIYYFYFAA